MANDFTHIGKRLSQIRKSRKITQEELSEKTGISRGTIQAIEYGITKDPGLTTLNKLLRAMDSSFVELGIDLRVDPKTSLKPLSQISTEELFALLTAARDQKKESEIKLLKSELEQIKSSVFWQAFQKASEDLKKYVMLILIDEKALNSLKPKRQSKNKPK